MTQPPSDQPQARPQDHLQDPALTQWLAVLNSDRDEAAARALLSPAIEVEVFPEGKGGPTKRYSGLDHTLTWLFRAKPGLYRFEAVSASPCDPAPQLPAAGRALAVRYRVWATNPDWPWQNLGDWVLHIDDASGSARPTLAALLHSPDALAT